MKRRLPICLALSVLILTLCLSDPAHAAIWYVSETTGSDTTGDGSSGNPYATINQALTSAESHADTDDEIRVGAGTYTEEFSLTTNLAAFTSLTFSGGYDPLTWQFNPTVYRTILDGGGIRNGFHIEPNGAGADVTIDGFVIQNHSTGIWLWAGRATVSNSILRNNSTGIDAVSWTGAPYPYWDSILSLSHNLFTNNISGFNAYSDGYYYCPWYCYYAPYYGCGSGCWGFCQLAGTRVTSENDTIAGNYTGISQYAVDPACSGGDLTIRNGIVDILYSNDSVSLIYTNQANFDPRFWDPAYTDHGLMPGSSCIDAGHPDAQYNDPDGTRNDMGFTGGASIWFDWDYDGMPDAWEDHYGLDSFDPRDGDWDCDGDSVTNRYEYFMWTDPGSCVDTDGDGLLDVEEVLIYLTDPNNWDTDGDFMSDLYEVINAGQSPPLDALDPADGDSSFEPVTDDSNPNFHEYWNNSDPWAEDPVPNPLENPACYYWGDVDGDGYVQANDINVLQNAVVGLPADYSRVIPSTGESQDLDADTFIQAGDVNIIRNFIADNPVGLVLSRAAALSKSYEPAVAISVGGTTHVTVALDNENATPQPSFAVVFSIDPTSTGSAILLGGEGEVTPGTRYDITDANGLATIALTPVTSGDIIINASVPPCGSSSVGRWCNQVDLSPPFTITVTP